MAFTYFFRDKHTLDLIAQHVLPTLKRHMYINIWDAGCAMGPEPYSLAITLRENMGPFLFRNVRIYATDIDENGEVGINASGNGAFGDLAFGDIIAQGIYPESRVKRIPSMLLERYFTRLPDAGGGGRRYQISPEMRKAVRYQRHDLLSLTPVRDNFGLILCKNVLLHFAPEARVAVIKMFHRALAQDGYLVMEQTQKLPPGLHPLFQRATSAGQIYQKIGSSEKRTTSDPASRGTELAARRTDQVDVRLDGAFSKVSDYMWLNIEAEGKRIGKARVHISPEALTIYSLSIFPAFQGRGCAQEVIALFQKRYPRIVADKVRPTARGFWAKMGFADDRHGNYVWRQG